MSIEFIGMIGTQEVSEILPATGPVLDPALVRRFAAVHEEAGFDKVLIGHSSSTPDGLQVAAYAAAHTDRLGFLVAHRPGFTAPTLAARQYATLDHFSGGGRVAMHVISGGSDTDQRRDGDWLGKDERYARTDEYLSVVRRAWTEREPFDHAGEHYRVAGVAQEIRPLGPIPVYFGGSSEAAYRVGGRHADVFALWGEPLAGTAEQIARVHEAARAAGRTEPPRISVSFRPILGDTEEQAWARAHDVRDRIVAARGGHGSFTGTRMREPGAPANVGSQRLLAAAEAGELHDRCLWTATAAASGAAGNSTALVGTPDTVAAALADYVDIGVTTLLIRGYDPIDDARRYGRELLPAVRAELARRGAAAGVGVPA
ncbi:Alkanesulfonate monooxygenase [Pseudonocardia sp. Ae406_Ps2]|uniref:LLM class flavin-dependent oxidoreductase n=1 Tax=unclassified Pseudonocardia TaxID=2619320 RepID=UPI00094ACC2B|nr:MULTISPECIES: LLM class flavin-dependent oxidoreductase [unclassified Pseudonocardia]OLM01935.1 Alkanesulfonate monooxygenase [Pseudonocardia sp. Ae406_Ps2]OLM06278.1 Alkanesulfonate monooxygenase [Pseudonocardia sp. Ae331_Ps2]OLM13017.1 Alkanesulfonate monooxygenase [Pseudonocardia sp. Ae505_Ps2]OLM23512.1 Alkanesulfonate monooxygenase [Pseudonocardia sp. Ae706_Ps2]OLM32556.1 Alkanesulfonate monooxygenase [Pseudonocardia sp. Ae717_Ps2]